jgi:Bacterial SH3 domain
MPEPRTIAGVVLGVGLLAAVATAETVRSTSRLNLRQGPSLSSRRVLVLSAGRDLEVLEHRGVWLRVRVYDSEGWVHSDYVTGVGTPPPADDGETATAPDLVARLAALEAEGAAAAAEIEELRRLLAATTAERDVLAARLEWLREGVAAPASAVAPGLPPVAGESLVRVAEPLEAGSVTAAQGQREAILAAVQRWARQTEGADVTDVEVTMLTGDRARVHCTLVTGSGRQAATVARVLEARWVGGAWSVVP